MKLRSRWTSALVILVLSAGAAAAVLAPDRRGRRTLGGGGVVVLVALGAAMAINACANKDVSSGVRCDGTDMVFLYPLDKNQLMVEIIFEGYGGQSEFKVGDVPTVFVDLRSYGGRSVTVRAYNTDTGEVVSTATEWLDHFTAVGIPLREVIEPGRYTVEATVQGQGPVWTESFTVLPVWFRY